MNLLAESAAVVFDGLVCSEGAIKEAIDDAGFEAELQPQVTFGTVHHCMSPEDSDHPCQTCKWVQLCMHVRRRVSQAALCCRCKG